MGRAGQRGRATREEHVEYGILDVPVHTGRGTSEDNAGPLHTGRVLRRGRNKALPHRL